MNWIPYGVLLKYVLKACSEYEEKQTAQFRCRCCWTNNHTTTEHQHPQLSPERRAELKKCQIALPFFLAAWVGIPAYLSLGNWFQSLVECLILWPVWALAVAYRIRKEQRKKNERAHKHQV